MFSPDTIIFVDEGIVHEEVIHVEYGDGASKYDSKKDVRTRLIISADGYYMELGDKVNWHKKGNDRMGRLLAYQECLEEIRKARANKESKAGLIIPPKEGGVNHEQDSTS